MPIDKIYHRNLRPILGEYGSINTAVKDERYALNPTFYTRSFDLIQKDLLQLFEFIEPARI